MRVGEEDLVEIPVQANGKYEAHPGRARTGKKISNAGSGKRKVKPLLNVSRSSNSSVRTGREHRGQ